MSGFRHQFEHRPEDHVDPAGAEVNLDALGLSADEQEHYRDLVVHGGGSVIDLAARTGRLPDEVERALAGLHGRGLVQTSEAEDREEPWWFPAAPDVALRGLLNERRHALEQAATSAAALSQIYRQGLNHADIGDLVDVVLGSESVAQRFLQIESGARDEVCAFVDAHPVALQPEDNTVESQALGRGVRFRVLIERDSLEAPGTLREIVPALQAHAEIRLIARVPTKLIIADATVAMVPLVVRGADAAALVIRAPSLVHALVTLFEGVWRDGVPVAAAEGGTAVEGRAPGPDQSDRDVLALMIAGLTDEATAKQLGLSVRTVQRRLRALLDLTGAGSRMQLGWEASERGWLTRRPRHPEDPSATS